MFKHQSLDRKYYEFTTQFTEVLDLEINVTTQDSALAQLPAIIVIGTVTRYYCDWHSYPLLLWLGRSYFYALGEVKYTYPKLHLRTPIQLLQLEPQHSKYSPHFWSTLVIGTIVWSFGIYNSEAHSVYQPAGSVTRLV